MMSHTAPHRRGVIAVVALALLAALVPISPADAAGDVLVSSGNVDVITIRQNGSDAAVTAVHSGRTYAPEDVMVVAGAASKRKLTANDVLPLTSDPFPDSEGRVAYWRNLVGKDVWVIPATGGDLPKIGFTTQGSLGNLGKVETRISEVAKVDGSRDAPFLVAAGSEYRDVRAMRWFTPGGDRRTQVAADEIASGDRQQYTWIFTEPGDYKVTVDVHYRNPSFQSDDYTFYIRVGTDAPPPPPGPFGDVPADHIFASEIEWLKDTGVTRGCNPPTNTNFCPDDPVTRAQMATFLVRYLGLSTPGTSTFDDVPTSNVHIGDIAALADAGITRGCNPAHGNTSFCPTQSVTRAQMASFLVRALDLPDATKTFGDVPNTNIHRADIAALYESGITKGCNPPANTNFCPTQPVTRAQMAAFLQRIPPA